MAATRQRAATEEAQGPRRPAAEMTFQELYAELLGIIRRKQDGQALSALVEDTRGWVWTLGADERARYDRERAKP